MAEPDLRITDFGKNLSVESDAIKLLRDLAAVLKDQSRKCLGGGQPPRPNPIPVIINEASHRMLNEYSDKELHSYGDPRGLPRLRETIAVTFHELYDWKINPDTDILVGPGSTFLNFLTLNTFAGPASGSMLTSATTLPQYIGYDGQYVGGTGNTVVSMFQKMERKSDNRFEFQPDLDLFKKTVQRPDVNLVKLSRQNNPTTQVIPDDVFHEIVDYAVKLGKTMFVDEAYGYPHPGYVYNGMKCEPVCGKGIVMTKTASKSCLAGDRVGLEISTDPRIMGRIQNISTNASFQSSTMSQALFETMWRHGDLEKIESQLRQYFQENERIAVYTFRKECAAKDNVLIHTSPSSFYLFYYFQNLPPGVTSADIYNRMKEQFQTPVVDGRSFFYGKTLNDNSKDLGYDPKTLSNSTIRVSLSETPSRLILAMTELAQATDSAYNIKR